VSDKRRPGCPAAKLGRPVRTEGERHTKERIFDSAVELFSEKGYDRTSVRQIAEAVGLTEAAIYKHYAGKSAILDEIIDYMERAVSAPLPAPGDAGSEGHSIFALLLLPLPSILSDTNLLRITRIMYAEMHHDDKIRSYIHKGLGERAVDALEAIFREQGESGAIKRCDYRSLARVFDAFRAEWLFETFVLDRGENLAPSRLEEELCGSIALFESAFLAEEKPR
jgi:AcrR family transcriptional regulator